MIKTSPQVKKAEADDETVCRTIVEKLADAKGVSYSEIAQTAYKVGRPALATRLLDYEPRAAQQVPLLMDMQEDELALVKAIDSGDTELVYYVLLQLKRKLSPGDFFRLIDNKPLAMSLLEVYCKQQDLDLLKDFYIFDDRTHETAFIAVREGYPIIHQIAERPHFFLLLLYRYESPDLALRLKSLKRAYETLKSDSNQAFAAKATEDQLKLLEFQIHLQKDVKDTIINMSLAQTIHYCLVKVAIKKNNADSLLNDKIFFCSQQSMGTQATKLKSDFRMEDKQYAACSRVFLFLFLSCFNCFQRQVLLDQDQGNGRDPRLGRARPFLQAQEQVADRFRALCRRVSRIQQRG